MFFTFSLALFGLFLIFLEFFLPGAVMAIGGALLLFASLFLFHMAKPGIPLLVAYTIILMASVYFVVKIALWRVKATGKKTALLSESTQEILEASLYPKELVGKKGHATTDLKPSGHIQVGDQVFHALSKTGSIEKGTPIEISGGHGSHLIVQPIPPGDPSS